MTILKNNECSAKASNQPSYFVSFEDEVVLPARLKEDARSPVLKAVFENKATEIVFEPWMGDVVFDMGSGKVVCNSGEATLEHVESTPEWGEYRLAWTNYTLTILCKIGAFTNEDGQRVNTLDAKINKAEDCEVVFPQKHYQELYQLVATCLMARSLDQAYKIRWENPETELINLEYLPDVTLIIGQL